MSDIAGGGDRPGRAPVVDPEAGAETPGEGVGPLILDPGSVSGGSGGAIWSLPHGGDLDANLVRLDPGQAIGAHINDEVDVLLVVQSGVGVVNVDGQKGQLGAGHLALIPKGSRRSIEAGPSGIGYLSIHRRRGPLEIERRHETDDDRTDG